MRLVPSQKILKDLMLGLIYPAVLGNIIYILLRFIFDQANTLLNNSHKFEWIVTAKFLLLIVTLAFYFCDYLYITFTNDFVKKFFWFDIVFILVLFCTIYLIHIDVPSVAPNNRWILICYFAFMFFYWMWDRYEKDRCNDDKEKDLYRRIIRWEILAMAGLLLWLGLSFIPKVGYYISEGIFIPLALITVYFAKYTSEKRRFYKLPEE